MPLALALLTESWQGIDAGQEFEYLSTEQNNGDWKYYVDEKYIELNKAKLGSKIVSLFTVSRIDDELLAPIFEELKISSFNDRASFNTLEKAQLVFKNDDTKHTKAREIFGTTRDNKNSEPIAGLLKQSMLSLGATPNNSRMEVFDAIVDVKFIIPNSSLTDSLHIRSDMGSHLPIIEPLVNITLFYVEDEKVQHTTNGVLSATYDIKANTMEQIGNQISSGIKHILIGLDHILFIIIFILIAKTWVDIIKTATIFTLGHSITLIIGVVGYSPSGAWFVPFVETAIAATIFYAAISVILGKKKSLSHFKIFAIGLLHGFGFSFILNEVMLNNGDIQLLSVLSFNLGIELGQIFIVAIVTPLIYWIDKHWLRRPVGLRIGLSAPCLAIACYWMVERGLQTYQSFTF
jgi:hydrogenase/urease accessory protein HupE